MLEGSLDGASDGVEDGVLGSEDGSCKALLMPCMGTDGCLNRTRYDMLQPTMRNTYVFADFHKSHLSPQLKLPSKIVIANDSILQIRPVTMLTNTSIGLLTTSTTVSLSPDASYCCIQHE